MSRLEIILTASITLSILLNIGLMVYARNVVTTLLSVSAEFSDLKNMTDSFAEHIKSVYELEMFYGDQTLSALMAHATSFNNYLDTFEYIYELSEDLKDTEFDNNQAEETTK